MHSSRSCCSCHCSPIYIDRTILLVEMLISREEVDVLCDRAKQAGVLLQPPQDSGYPIGYWAFLRDPDGHTLELSFGQEIGLTVEQIP